MRRFKELERPLCVRKDARRSNVAAFLLMRWALPVNRNTHGKTGNRSCDASLPAQPALSVGLSSKDCMESGYASLR
ncbi:hypothetical protein GFL18_25360 [Rhizobium leguminosarum bv. viciae]|nr:hypothetical protein [Rhizobium leguminosarum bv. viciae]